MPKNNQISLKRHKKCRKLPRNSKKIFCSKKFPIICNITYWAFPKLDFDSIWNYDFMPSICSVLLVQRQTRWANKKKFADSCQIHHQIEWNPISVWWRVVKSPKALKSIQFLRSSKLNEWKGFSFFIFFIFLRDEMISKNVRRNHKKLWVFDLF